MKKFNIQRRARRLINTDPQRRCYNGCHFKSELIWTNWEVIELAVPESKLAQRMDFWRDLNAYAVSQRGEAAQAEFRAEI